MASGNTESKAWTNAKERIVSNTKFVIRYGFIFEIGKNYHKVSIYPDGSWTKESGLVGTPIATFENPKITEILKELNLQGASKKTIEVVKQVAQSRDNYVVIDNSSKVLEN